MLAKLYVRGCVQVLNPLLTLELQVCTWTVGVQLTLIIFDLTQGSSVSGIDNCLKLLDTKRMVQVPDRPSRHAAALSCWSTSLDRLARRGPNEA